MAREVVVVSDPAALAREAAGRFAAAAAESVVARGRFSVALAGGSTPATLYRLLAQNGGYEGIAWDRTLVFFGDERRVPPDHPDSNYRMVAETLLAGSPIPPANVYRMAGELPGEEAAAGYARALAQAIPMSRDATGNFPVLDLVLLGMGDDGHTASLFPGMPALDEEQQVVVATEVPAYVRPAVARLTLTLPVLNAAHRVIFLVAGAAKAASLAAILGNADPGTAPLPAGRVRPSSGAVTWLLDAAAAQGLK